MGYAGPLRVARRRHLTVIHNAGLLSPPPSGSIRRTPPHQREHSSMTSPEGNGAAIVIPFPRSLPHKPQKSPFPPNVTPTKPFPPACALTPLLRPLSPMCRRLDDLFQAIEHTGGRRATFPSRRALLLYFSSPSLLI